MPSKKQQEEFLEKMRRLFNINAFTHEHISEIKSEGLLNELFIENKNITLLMYYVKKNDLEKVKFLLNEPNSAKTNVVSNVNKLNALAIAVHEACQNRDYCLEIIDELLKFNPSEQLLQKNKHGYIPIHLAAKSGHLPLMRKLLQHNPKEQLRVIDDLNQDTVSSCIMKSKNIELITWLFDTYPEVLKDVLVDGFTLMHLACKLGDKQLLKILLDRGDIKQLRQTPNAAGRIPLIVACAHGHFEIAQELLKINPSKQLSAVDENGHNAFHVACLQQSESFLKLFLQAAKQEYLHQLLHKETLKGQTPLKIALILSKENPKMLGIIRLLLNAGSTVTVEMFEMIIGMDHLLVLEEFLKHGFDLNKVDQLGRTALNAALYQKKPKAVEMLLLCGADPNLMIMDNSGKTYCPLLIASYGPDIESLKLLKQHGAKMTDEVMQFIIKTHGQKQQIYKKMREVWSDLPDLAKKPEPVKQEKENVPEPHSVSQAKLAMSGRQFLLEQGCSIKEIEDMKKPANITLSWELQTSKKAEPAKVVFLDGVIDSHHKAIVPIENSKCFCYLDTVTLEKQGLNIEDLKISRFKFSPDNIKILDKDKGVYQDTIKLSANHPGKKTHYTHELKINELDRIFMIQEGALFIGLKYVPGGVHTQAKIRALHERNKENSAALNVQWPEGLLPRPSTAKMTTSF